MKEGKSKKFYTLGGGDNNGELFMVFKPHLRSITSKREENIPGTDIERMKANAVIMNYLNRNGIPTHAVDYCIHEIEGKMGMLVKEATTFPIEFIVRFYAAGSIVRLYPSLVKEGQKFRTPLYKYDLKQDVSVAGVDDPPLFENYITGLGLMTEYEFNQANNLLVQIGRLMDNLMNRAGMRLIDMKMEFGKDGDGNIILIDEITQDCIRANDIATGRPMTKDAFRNMQTDEEVLDVYKEFNSRIMDVLG